jgi:hypothetical protein
MLSGFNVKDHFGAETRGDYSNASSPTVNPKSAYSPVCLVLVNTDS